MLDSHQERTLITGSKKRPYGAKIVFEVLDSTKIGGLEHATFLLSTGAVATIAPAAIAPWEGGKRFEIKLEGYSTATQAETAGTKFADALLLAAVSLNAGLRLVYAGALPATVYERYRAAGLSVSAYGSTGWPPLIVVNELNLAFDAADLDKSLVLSMELCSSSLLETNERSRFVGVVSALEPLAIQNPLGEEVDKFVAGAIDSLEKTDLDPALKQSLSNRLNHLKRESVRQALLRMYEVWFPGCTEARKSLDRAYALRSELLHSGAIDDGEISLREEADTVIKYLRRIYSQASGRPFQFPTS